MKNQILLSILAIICSLFAYGVPSTTLQENNNNRTTGTQESILINKHLAARGYRGFFNYTPLTATFINDGISGNISTTHGYQINHNIFVGGGIGFHINLGDEGLGVAIPVYNATEPRVALNQNKKSSLLKLYSSDVGLLTCQYGNAVRMNILMEDRHVNLGGIYENAVAQELNTHGFPLYYYNSHKQGELDFVIEKGFSVIPLEVKSGKDYRVHSAISNVSGNPEYDIQEAYVLANSNISREGKITYLPVYMAMFIQDDVKLPILEPIG